jgi:hypothetical protein
MGTLLLAGRACHGAWVGFRLARRPSPGENQGAVSKGRVVPQAGSMVAGTLAYDLERRERWR